MQTKVLVSMTRQQVEALDKLVESGVYSSRSEALRDAARLLIRQSLGSLPHPKPGTSSVQLARESRKELWETALARAGGDKTKALYELKKLVEH